MLCLGRGVVLYDLMIMSLLFAAVYFGKRTCMLVVFSLFELVLPFFMSVCVLKNERFSEYGVREWEGMK